jgi:hypothetical protein
MIAITVASGATAQTAQDRAHLVREFPRWHIWNSRAGRWWATRRGNERLSRDHDPAWSMTVDADTPEELRDSLHAQQEMR